MDNTFKKIHKYVVTIPKGKVATYGDISNRLDLNNPKIVGWALHINKDEGVPCHRVVNKEGCLAENFAFGGWEGQKEKLVKEKVEFMSEKQVNMKKCHYQMVG